MEVTHTHQVSNHAASLLASLNLQRDRAQFCDCVVRQRQSPAHLYPAHRCVLAASSPVLASLLSTTSALVDLQAPCLSDSVLGLVLDYVYTGALKPPTGHQQYCSLLAAACYLQMDKLQEALRAWHRTEMYPHNTNVLTGPEGHLHLDTINTPGHLVRACNKTHNQPVLPNTDSYRKSVETGALSGLGINSLEKQDHQHSASSKICAETPRHSANIDSSIKHIEKDTCSSSSINDVNYSSKPTSTANTVNPCCSIAVITVSSVNTPSCIRLNSLIEQNWLRSLPSTAEGHKVPRRQQCHSASTAAPDKGQASREEVLVRTAEEKRSPYSPYIAVQVQEEVGSRAEMMEQLDSPRTSKPEEERRKREEKGEKEDYSFSRHKCSRTQDEFQDSPLLPPFCRPHHLHRDDGSHSGCSSSSSSSSSPHSCGAVPVICHGKRAAMVQLAEASALPALHPASEASTGIIRPQMEWSDCHRTTIPLSASPREGTHSSNSKDNASIGTGITVIDRTHYGEQNRGYRNNKDHTGMQSWDYIDNNPKSGGIQKYNYTDSLDHCGVQNTSYKPGTSQYEMLKQDYKGSNTGHFGIHNDEHDCMDYGLSQMTDNSDNIAHYGSLQSNSRTKHPRGDGISQNKDNKDFPNSMDYRDPKYEKTDLGFDEHLSRQQPMKRSDCQDVSMATAEEKQAIHSPYQKLVSQEDEISLPVLDSDTGSDSLCGDRSSRGRDEKNCHSTRYTAETDRLESHEPYRLKEDSHDSYSSLHRADKNRTDTASSSSRAESHSSLHKTITDNRDGVSGPSRSTTDIKDRDVYLPVCTTPEPILDNVMGSFSASDQSEREEGPPEPHPSMEFENISDTEITEPSCTVPVFSNSCDPTYNLVGHSYRGHLRYHCLSHEQTHLTWAHSKHTRSSHPLHLHPDQAHQSGDREGTGTCAGPGHSPLRQHCARGRGSQVLLLDISTKPAELLVSHRAGGEEEGVAFRGRGEKGTIETGNDNKKQWKEAKFEAGLDKGDVRTTFGTWTKSFVEDKAEVGHEAGTLVGGDKAKVESVLAGASTSLPACVSPSVLDCVTASMSLPLPVCIPSTLPGCMPSSVPAHLSTPIHQPYQCSLCDRSFSQRGSLNRHMRSHLGVRPYPCPRCPMTFSRQYRVTEHMRVHQRFALGEDLEKPPTSSI